MTMTNDRFGDFDDLSHLSMPPCGAAHLPASRRTASQCASHLFRNLSASPSSIAPFRRAWHGFATHLDATRQPQNSSISFGDFYSALPLIAAFGNDRQLRSTLCANHSFVSLPKRPAAHRRTTHHGVPPSLSAHHASHSLIDFPIHVATQLHESHLPAPRGSVAPRPAMHLSSHLFEHFPFDAHRMASLHPTVLHCSRYRVATSRCETHPPFINQFSAASLGIAPFRALSPRNSPAMYPASSFDNFHPAALRFAALHAVSLLCARLRSATFRSAPRLRTPATTLIIFIWKFPGAPFRIALHRTAAHRSAPHCTSHLTLREKRFMAKLNIYIPDSLKERMGEKPDENWSKIGQRAFEAHLAEGYDAGGDDVHLSLKQFEKALDTLGYSLKIEPKEKAHD